MDSPEKTEVFLALYNREQRKIYGLIRALVYNRDDAEEVFQETCIALWRSFGDFTPGTDFAAWAAQIARNRVLAHRKAQRRVPLSFGDDVTELIAQDMRAKSSLLDDRRQALASCVEKLTDKDRRLVDRHYGEGISIVALAEEAGRPLNTFYKTIQRIRRGLMECIERTISREEHPNSRKEHPNSREERPK